jgi:hypothetical protein
LTVTLPPVGPAASASAVSDVPELVRPAPSVAVIEPVWVVEEPSKV